MRGDIRPDELWSHISPDCHIDHHHKVTTSYTKLSQVAPPVQRAQDTGAARELVVRNSLEVAIG